MTNAAVFLNAQSFHLHGDAQPATQPTGLGSVERFDGSRWIRIDVATGARCCDLGGKISKGCRCQTCRESR